MHESWKLIVLVVCIYMIVWCSAQSQQNLSVDNSWLIYTKIDKCQASSTFPSIGSNGIAEFAPENAISKGSGYWSSAGNHEKDSIVSWTGWITNPRQLKGIEIHWAYAPDKVSILASADGSEANFRRVTDFQACDTGNASFDQQIFFPVSVRAKAIRIEMKGAPHEYMGINLVQLIVGNSIVRLQSGVTSAYQDMCLVADESNEIVLDGCVEAIAAMDGRDLWLFTAQGLIMNPIRNSCIVLKDNSEVDGGNVFLDDCFTAYNHRDGRGTWELQKNNQLKLLKGGNLCLSQKGSKAGSSDVAVNRQAATSHPRLEDTHHGPEMAIDGNSSTYWVSVAFPLDVVPDAVYLDVNLGDKYKIKSVAIDWLYPAISYIISISKDGKTWNEVVGNIANSLHSTVNSLRSSIAQYVRIVMKKPHPRLAKVENSMVYGIKTLSIFSNRLKSVVEDCGKAGISKDSRDKFFLEMVSEVDISPGNQLRRSNAALLNETSSLSTLTANIEEILPSAVTCLNDKKILKENLLTLRGQLGDIKEQLSDIEESINEFGIKLLSTKQGYTANLPAEDCINLKQKDPLAVSGFYYIRPPCSPSPLRVFCDMSVGASYFVPPDNDISELKDTLRICANFGMKPIQLHNAAQISSLHTMLKIMDIDLRNPVPIAANNGTGRYFDTGMEIDITDLLFMSYTPKAPLGNTAGIGKDGLVFFDGSSTDMSGIICSTNTDSLVPGPTFVEVSCGTTVKNNPLFNLPIGFHATVKCPENCLEVEAAVIGTDVYNEESSVCLAAIHNGAYDKSGLVVVDLVEGLYEYFGSNRNGVSSDSYKTTNKQIAFKVNKMVYKCPGITEPSMNASFMEIEAIVKSGLLVEKNTVGNSTSMDPSLDILDPKTGGAIRNLLLFTNKLYSTVDPAFLHNIQDDVGKTVSKARATLKAASKLHNYTNEESSELLNENEEFRATLESVSSKINSRLHNAQQELSKLMAERALQSASNSWAFTPLNENEFFDVFEVITSPSAIGNPKWHLTNSLTKLSSGKTVIGQTSSVTPIDPSVAAVGTYLMLRNKRYFDSIFSANIYMTESGVYGMAFRAKGKNMYLLEVKQLNGGYKRLIRIEDGKPTEIARLDDGGYITGKWYTVRIHTQQARIMISIVEVSQEPLFVKPEPIIDVIDEVLSSGTIGLYTSSTNGAYFENVQVEALPCVRLDTPLVSPLAPHCSNFRESFVKTFKTTWQVVEPETAVNGPAEWKYAENIGGEAKVLVQTSSVKGIEDTIPTIAVLKKRRSCDNGVVSFSFLPQCEAGIIGGVFNYKDSHNYNIFEAAPSFVRLRRNSNGQFTTYIQSANTGYALSKWNKVTIVMNKEHVAVYTGDDISSKPLFNLIGTISETGGSIGLASYNCPGVAFTHIEMHPHENEMLSPSINDVPATTVQFEQSGMDVCLKKRHIVERMEFCFTISGKYRFAQKRCKSNFCDSCCENQFPTSSNARVTCKNHCHEGDYISILSDSALQWLQAACTIDPSSSFYNSCKKEETEKNQCLVELCGMCCHTAAIPDKYEQSYYGKTLLKKECERRCSIQDFVYTDFEEL